MYNSQEIQLEMIRGTGNPYFIPKGGCVREEKCVVMDKAKLQIVQYLKLAKMTCNLGPLSPQCHTLSQAGCTSSSPQNFEKVILLQMV